MAGIIDLVLERDGHDQPWGFRLQGGHDVGIPLSIQRVLVGTPSEGIMKKGDVLVRISNTDAKGLSHQQAADLFTNTGNQIKLQFKRAGAPSQAAPSHPVAAPHPVPVSGGIPLPGMTTLSQGRSQDTLLLNLPKTRGATKPQSSSVHQAPTAPLSLTIQHQPYRTSPLIQPSAKSEVGPGSATHLKMQADYLTGVKEAIDSRPSDFSMKQKVTGTLQSLQHQSPTPPCDPYFKPQFTPSGTSASPIPMEGGGSSSSSKQAYNNPIALYSRENVAQVAKANQMGVSALPASPTGLLHPVNKPTKHWLNMGSLSMKYDPEQSATWQAIHETEKCELVTEHGPTASKVYSI